MRYLYPAMCKTIFGLFRSIARCLPSVWTKEALTIALLKKEVEILSRGRAPSSIAARLGRDDRLVIAFVARLLGRDAERFLVFSPETVLAWFRAFMRARWTFPHASKPRGRTPVPGDVKELILTMKNGNLTWGAGRIQGELSKLGIGLHRSTVANILRTLRREGKIARSGSWAKFLKAHAESLFATDFFTVDTLFGKTLYFLFIIEHRSRRIVHLAMTGHPTREFLKQRMILFAEEVPGEKRLIHDNGAELCSLDYSMLGIEEIRTSVKAPDMNAFAERFVLSVRRECLDRFVVVNEKQAWKLVKEYVEYYNELRPHQGIGQRVPEGYEPQPVGRIRASPVLGGLHHRYYRAAAWREPILRLSQGSGMRGEVQAGDSPLPKNQSKLVPKPR